MDISIAKKIRMSSLILQRKKILQQLQKENNSIEYENKNRPLGRDL